MVLPNHLHALLIHAPGSDRAAAAASVARGSDHDPDAHEGLAHFVEHMLFIATEKYPEVDGFTDFVLKHGGSYSAYTASDRTTYHFHLKADRLPEALDRFAQFFVAPRFDPDYVEREKESVQSEYQLQSKQDEWRGFAVDKRLFNPAHPDLAVQHRQPRDPARRRRAGSARVLRGQLLRRRHHGRRFSDLKTSTTWEALVAERFRRRRRPRARGKALQSAALQPRDTPGQLRVADRQGNAKPRVHLSDPAAQAALSHQTSLVPLVIDRSRRSRNPP